MSEVNGTVINSGVYFSITQMVKITGKARETLQWHINRGNISTISIPGLGRIVSYQNLVKFQERPDGRRKNE